MEAETSSFASEPTPRWYGLWSQMARFDWADREHATCEARTPVRHSRTTSA